MTLPRVVAPETLDHLAPADPAAQRSRRDLARIHRVMSTRRVVAHGWQGLLCAPPVSSPLNAPLNAPLKVLDMGAGDGTLLLGVARRLAPTWPRVQLTLLDRQPVVSPATLAAYAGFGWSATVQAVDVLDWAAPVARLEDTLPAAPWDLITTSLFLHHFEGAQLDAVLAAVTHRALRFFACEPRRAWLALAGSHLVGALGANAVTRADAVLSVHAGFRAQEITARWPGIGTGTGTGIGTWQCQEYAAGLFSHCFSARRDAVSQANVAWPLCLTPSGGGRRMSSAWGRS